MGWTGEINTLEELEALMCGNVLPSARNTPTHTTVYRVGRRFGD